MEPRAKAFRISRSNVPWSRSPGFSRFSFISCRSFRLSIRRLGERNVSWFVVRKKNSRIRGAGALRELGAQTRHRGSRAACAREIADLRHTGRFKSQGSEVRACTGGRALRSKEDGNLLRTR